MKLWGRKSEPIDPNPIDPAAIRERTKAELARLGGHVTPTLPLLDLTKIRSAEALTDRALVLNAMIGLGYEAPVPLIRGWIVENGLRHALSTEEAAMLERESENFTPQERVNLTWSIEALFAFLWAGGYVPDLGVDRAFSGDVFEHLPAVPDHETGREFARRVRLRPAEELVAQLDLYYCAHWFARDGGLNGYDTGVFESSPILERRKALEWLLDDTVDWDDVDQST